MSTVKIVSTGRFIPETVVTNDDISQFVDTTDEWITSRSGIRTRHFANDITNTEMAVEAGRKALEKSRIDVSEIGCCLVATFTPDTFTPSVACMVQRELGLAEDVLAFDINAACSGFIYGMRTAQGLLMQQAKKYALVIGSEKTSSFLDFADRSTCVLFGDGAGAAVIKLEECEEESLWTGGTRGNSDAIMCSVRPDLAGDLPSLCMNGKEVFQFATEAIRTMILDLLSKANLDLDAIDHVVCHQANERIISHVYKKLKADPKKFFTNLQKYGNTSAASIPIALDEMGERGMLKKGEKVILVGFGAGLTWGGTLLTI